MAKYSWPTDPPGKPASHSIPYAQHQQHLGGQPQGYTGWSPSGGYTSAPAPGTPAWDAKWAVPAPAPEAPRAPDWAEQMATTTANRNVALSDSQATYDRGRIGRDFGYDAAGQIDPNNPYSQASLLETTYKNATQGNTNSYAAQGQLYSGSLQNAQNETTRQHSIGVNQLQNSYQDQLHGVSQQQLGTYANAGSAVSDESFQALLRKLNGG